MSDLNAQMAHPDLDQNVSILNDLKILCQIFKVLLFGPDLAQVNLDQVTKSYFSV